MQYLKKIFSTPQLAKFFSWQNWPYWVALLILVALVVLLVFLIKRRRAKKAQTPVPATKIEPFPSSGLVDIWKEFLREIPGEFRRSILLYDSFIVFGEPAAGKSSLIDACTDWQGQARQFYPSYIADPQLQIYLGSKAIVQEIPPALLNDTSKPARAALRRLWRPFFRKKEPTVVVVLNGANLQSDSPDALKKHAQMIRGKINILSRLCRKPVNVGIALSHMDQREGFLEFSNYLRRNNIPLNLKFESPADLQDLQTCLEPDENFLTHALTTLPAEDYQRIISFWRHTPELLATVSVFIKILRKPDPLSPDPRVVRLSLTSQKEEHGVISNPFETSISDRDHRRFHPLIKHQIAATALAVLGFMYLGAGYLYERNLLSDTAIRIDRIEASPPAHEDYRSEIHRLFLDFGPDLKKDPLLAFLPNFFPDLHESINKRLVYGIRKLYLIPALERLATLKQDQEVKEKTLYLMTLICATNGSELGELILENLKEDEADWTGSLGLPSQLIKDYIHNNNNLQDSVNDLSSLNLASFVATGQPPDLLAWLVYFRQVRKIYKQPWVTTAQLHKLQQKAAEGLNLLSKLKRYALYSEFSKLLKSELAKLESSIFIDFTWVERRGTNINHESVHEFLKYLRGLSLEANPAEELSLGQLMETINSLMDLSRNGSQPDTTFIFKLDDGNFVENFEFTQNKWQQLITRSRITLILRNFIVANQGSEGLLFFKAEDDFGDILMNPTNEGRFLFTGKGRVDGRFTREAFEQGVKPVLLELPEFLKGLPVQKGETSRFRNLVFQETQSYASQYVDQWRAYYRHFDIQTQSPGELRIMLNQMQLPSSPYENFLLTIKENTVLELGDTPYFRPFSAELSVFKFIQSIIQQPKDAVPELERYKAILAMMQKDIENDKPPAPQNGDEAAEQLKSQLSPLARIFLSIFREEESSYLKIAQKWVDNVPIKPEFQFLFLEPFHQAFILGRPEVQNKVGKLWEDLRQSEIQPILIRFPFNPQAELAVSPAELDSALHPQHGSFWKNFRKNLAPVCREVGGIWRKQNSLMGSLGLPENMLETVNRAARLTKMLWDAKGLPQPVFFHFRSFSLPPVVKGRPVAVLSYIKSGKGSAYCFNQKPVWQKFDLEWWKQQSATVGVQFLTSPDAPNMYKSISVPKSTWSFYRLLNKSEMVETNVLQWAIDSLDSQAFPLRVKFEIRTDPWAVVRLLR